jgi:opacity protein-like surface antigen
LTTATVELNRVYSLLLKGSYPLLKGLNVNAYVGGSSVKFLVDSNQNYHSENSDSSVSVGAGLSYDIASDVFINADYMAYTKNVTALQVGMGFRF